MRLTGSRPTSLKVGVSGRSFRRCGAATTMGTSLPVLMKGSDDGTLSKMMGTWPATTSFSAGPAPR